MKLLNEQEITTLETLIGMYKLLEDLHTNGINRMGYSQTNQSIITTTSNPDSTLGRVYEIKSIILNNIQDILESEVNNTDELEDLDSDTEYLTTQEAIDFIKMGVGNKITSVDLFEEDEYIYFANGTFYYEDSSIVTDEELDVYRTLENAKWLPC